MKYLVVLFAIVAIVAANPEQERERRGILAAPALAAPWAIPKIVTPPVVYTSPKLLSAPATIIAAPALPAWGGLKAW